MLLTATEFLQRWHQERGPLPRSTLYHWLRQGWLPSERELVPLKGGLYRNEYRIDERYIQEFETP